MTIFFLSKIRFTVKKMLGQTWKFHKTQKKYRNNNEIIGKYKKGNRLKKCNKFKVLYKFFLQQLKNIESTWLH